jgi:hypothetical protein
MLHEHQLSARLALLGDYKYKLRRMSYVTVVLPTPRYKTSQDYLQPTHISLSGIRTSWETSQTPVIPTIHRQYHAFTPTPKNPLVHTPIINMPEADNPQNYTL